jgi:hypothetical protein
MISPPPSKNLETVLVKAPHRKEVFTEDELIEFAACADPVTGPLVLLGSLLLYPASHTRQDAVSSV